MYKSTSVHSVVNDYFRALSERVVGNVARLFADDAVLLPSPMPATGPVEGRAAIAALYEKWFKVPMKFVELRMYDEGQSCAVEIRVEVGEDRRIMEVVDIFDIGANGRISRMSVYKR
jgi:ketosteroid isomerase-like protein